MKDRQNTINGWVLFAGIVALGSSILAGEVFHSERPETMGYPIEGVAVEEDGPGAEKPIAFYLASGDPAKGEQVFKKCAACHNADPGGANALGPALFGVMGKPIAGQPGFAYSDALKGVGGSWDWDKMSAWLANPKKFAPGTKMTFAGLSNPQDRADVMLWMNSKGGSLTVPPPPADAGQDSQNAPATGSNDMAPAEQGEKEPVLNGVEEPRGQGEGDEQGR